jgi:thioredoxin reductase
VKIEDVIIVGAGPAGLATALQLERYGIKPLIIEQARIGGLLHNANLVENYPGFPGGIPGPRLVNLFKEQVKDYELNIQKTRLEKLAHADDLFEFTIPGKIIYSRIAVIASGTKPRLIQDIDLLDEVQKQVFYEVFPLLEVKNKKIAIIGAGDAAFDYALNLAQYNDLLILNRGKEVRCLPLLWERSKASSRIQYHPDTSISSISITPDKRLQIDCRNPRGQTTIAIDYLVAAIGREPNLDFMSSQISENTIQLENSGKLFFVGDVVRGLYRQTSIAIGDGILTAMKIYQSLKENRL